jgi:hypothetical protein
MLTHVGVSATALSDRRPFTWKLPLTVWAIASVTACLYQWYGAAFHHVSGPRWWVGGDELWFVVTSAFVNTHGGFAHLYAFDKPTAQLVTPPGLILPVALVVHLVSLIGGGSTTFQLSAKTHGLLLIGQAWDIVVPLLTVGSMATVFPVDALARRLDIDGWRRGLLAVLTAASLWWVAVSWGHPDEAIAIGLIAGALSFTIDGRHAASAWCVGIGIAVQPLVLLVVPAILAFHASRRWPPMVARMLLPASALLLIPLIGDPTDTLSQLLGQPVYTKLPTSHPLPWLAFARHIVNNGPGGGPMNTVAVVLAVVIAWLVMRNEGVTRDPALLVWLAGAGESLRCIFESVLIPYYVVPGLLLCLVAGLRLSAWRIASASALAAVTAWLSESHALGAWGYFAVMVAGLGGVAALAWRTIWVSEAVAPCPPTPR